MSETIYVELAVMLTEPELKARAEQLASLMEEKEQQNEHIEDLKLHLRGAREIAKGIDKSAQSLAKTLLTKHEKRPVECAVVIDLETNRRAVIRNDLSKVVSMRALTDTERQQTLFEQQQQVDQDVAQAMLDFEKQFGIEEEDGGSQEEDS